MPDIQPLLDAWNAHDPDAVVALYADGGSRVQMAYPSERLEGAALLEHIKAIMHTSDDFVLESRGVGVSEDGTLTFEWTWTATVIRDFGPVPGKGQKLVLNGVSVSQMDGDRIREERVYWDGAEIMAAAGMLG